MNGLRSVRTVFTNVSLLAVNNSLHYRKTGLCRLLKSFTTYQRQGSRQIFSLPTAPKSSRQRILCRLSNYPGRWQRKAVGKDVLCRLRGRVAKKSWWQRWLPRRWQRKAGGKGGGILMAPITVPFAKPDHQAVGKDKNFYF